eukprot:10436344-Alexandrium_andersonii.AAC.1
MLAPAGGGAAEAAADPPSPVLARWEASPRLCRRRWRHPRQEEAGEPVAPPPAPPPAPAGDCSHSAAGS